MSRARYDTVAVRVADGILIAGTNRPILPANDAKHSQIALELAQESDGDRAPSGRFQEDPMLRATARLWATATPTSRPSGRLRLAWSAVAGRRQRVLACFAAVTMGVATLVGSADAVVPLRAVPSGTPATPVPVAGSVVTFLWEADGGPDFPLDRPAGAAIDPQGNLWVTDGANDRFVIFSPDGVALAAWGTSGSGDGEFAFACRGVHYGGVALMRLATSMWPMRGTSVSKSLAPIVPFSPAGRAPAPTPIRCSCGQREPG